MDRCMESSYTNKAHQIATRVFRDSSAETKDQADQYKREEAKKQEKLMCCQ